MPRTVGESQASSDDAAARIAAAYATYRAWRPVATEYLDRVLERSDRHHMALAGLVGYLTAAVRHGLSVQVVADAVEYALRSVERPDVSRSEAPAVPELPDAVDAPELLRVPFVKASPAEVAAAFESSAVYGRRVSLHAAGGA